jgi:hypothetical protein
LANELLAAGFFAWLLAAIIALTGRGLIIGRSLLFLGSLAGIIAAILALPDGTSGAVLPTELAGEPVKFLLTPDGLWLLGFGLAPAALAGAVASPSPRGQAGWLFGAAMSLIGALGVFGLRDGASFIIAWEIMSFGGALMILSEKLSAEVGRPVLFMLGLLEVGAVALIAVILLLAYYAHSFAFDTFPAAVPQLSALSAALIGVLLIIGFGAKLGLLPFYEWFPNLYGSGSGATGVLLSGVVLNAAFFGLSRGLLDWLPAQNAPATAELGTFVLIVAVASAILTALYAFQQEDWRSLLSFSSAENASIAVAMLGASLMFRGDGLRDLASLAWVVALLHLAGHAPDLRLRISRDGRLRDFPFRSAAAQLLGVRIRRPVRRHESRRHAASGRIRQRVVRLPDRFPGLPSRLARRPTGAGAGRRRLGAHHCRCIRNLRESLRLGIAGPLGSVGCPGAARLHSRCRIARRGCPHAGRRHASLVECIAGRCSVGIWHAGRTRNERRILARPVNGKVRLYLAHPPCRRHAASGDNSNRSGSSKSALPGAARSGVVWRL